MWLKKEIEGHQSRVAVFNALTEACEYIQQLELQVNRLSTKAKYSRFAQPRAFGATSSPTETDYTQLLEREEKFIRFKNRMKPAQSIKELLAPALVKMTHSSNWNKERLATFKKTFSDEI